MPGFWKPCGEVTQRHGIVLIFDEVVTGFRIAWGGAQERYGVVPDLATLWQGDVGWIPHGGYCRAIRRDGVPGCTPHGSFEAGLGERHAERQSDQLHCRPGSAGGSCAAGRVRATCTASAAACGAKIKSSAHATASPRKHPGEDAVFGVRFTDLQQLRNWEDLLTADKDLGLRWSLELIKRGILVNPNEKFYISTSTPTQTSIAHSKRSTRRFLHSQLSARWRRIGTGRAVGGSDARNRSGAGVGAIHPCRVGGRLLCRRHCDQNTAASS